MSTGIEVLKSAFKVQIWHSAGELGKSTLRLWYPA